MRALWQRVAVGLAIGMVLVRPAANASSRHHYTPYTSYSTDHYYAARIGYRVHNPVAADRALAGCRDQPWSFSESRRDTCSHPVETHSSGKVKMGNG